MDRRVLEYFLAVVEEGSITKAAEVLHVTQPNVSRQIKELEEDLEKKLIVRGKRGISLTEEGLFFKKRAEEIVALMERTEVDLSLFDENIQGDVYFGAPETNTIRNITYQIQELRKKHPGIIYHLYSGSTVEVMDQLDKGLLNFAILVDQVDPQEYNVIRLTKNDVWGVLMHKESPLAKLDYIEPKDIRDKPIIASQQMLDAKDISDWLGEDFRNLNIILTFNLITSPAMMIEEGMGYTFTFDKLVNTTGDSDLAFRPLKPKFETGLYLVWKKDQIFTKAAEAFLNQLKNNML